MSALSFLGLAMRAGRVEVGEEYIAMAARAGKAKVILTASDAGENALTRAQNASAAAHCPVAALPYPKEALGAALGKGPVSAAAVTDISFASAFIDKLSTEHPGFSDIKAALDRQNEKALERQREARRHQANIRRGKKK